MMGRANGATIRLTAIYVTRIMNKYTIRGGYVRQETSWVKWKVETDDEGWPQLRISVNGLGDDYGFTLRYVPEEHREWLIEVLVRQFDELAKRAQCQGREMVAKPLRDALEPFIGFDGSMRDRPMTFPKRTDVEIIPENRLSDSR